MQGRQILTQAQLQQHVTQLSTQDIIWAPLYDANTYVGTTGHLQLTFFLSPIGTGVTSAPGASGPKTIADTNMTAQGQLTQGNDFFMVGQEVLFYPGENPGVGLEAAANVGNFINDTYSFSKAGTLTLSIGSNRQYIQDGPMAMFPPLTRLSVATALAGGEPGTGTQNASEVTYAAMGGSPYNITPVYITATLGFNETFAWPALVALPSGNNARVFSRMDGWLIRNSQ
jgi:hypothetical protein